tara:strand:- start:2789 stop:3490 length:702 start_codon:yes stop_codon:yes gene_type:complete
MNKHLTLLLFIGLVWGQNTFKNESKFDRVVSKGGTIYLGEFSRIKKGIVYFKPTKTSAFQGIPISQIQSLKLKDGKTIIKNGNVNKIRTVVDYEKLSIEEKAIYDAKKDAKKWLAYPPLALIGAGGLATATFYIGEDIFDMSDESILFPSIFGGSLGAVGTYYLFDKRGLEVIEAEDIQVYEKFYLEVFKKRKLKNIITSSSIVGITAFVGAWIIFSSFDMSGYDACFDPRCN